MDVSNLPDLPLDTAHLIALAAALGWASGLRLYAVVFLTGLAGALGWVTLPDGLHVLSQPPVLWASGAFMLIEFLADKIPFVDSLWDTVHTLIRIPAGAWLAASVFGLDQGASAVLAALLGGGLAATSHAAKTATRAAANTSPEPFSNMGLSLAGDAAVPTMLWLAWAHPVWFAIGLALALALMVTLIATFAKFLGGMVQRVRHRFAAV